MAEYIYTMVRARKAHGDKVILDDVTLSFLPGAKIGVVGPNGAGKSTVLKIMAGLEQPSNGEAFLSPGYSVGILAAGAAAQRDARRARQRRGGVAETAAHARPVQRGQRGDGRPRRRLRRAARRDGRAAGALDHRDGWELDARSSRPWTRCAARPATPTSPCSPVVSGAASRCASCCSRRPTCCCSTSPPTTSTPRACSGWSSTWRSTPAPSSPSPTTGTSSTTSPSGSSSSTAAAPTPTRATTRPTWRPRPTRLKVEGAKDAKRAKRLKDELEWVRSGAKARQAKSKARLARYEEMAAEADKTRKLDFEEIQIPPGPRLGSVVVETDDLTKGFGDRVLIDDLSFTLPRNGIVGVIGPNGAGKTTLFKMLVGEEKPDDGEIKVGETVKISYVDQNRSGIDPKKTLWEVVSDGLDHIKVGNVEMPSRAYVARVRLQGPRPAEAGRRAVRRRAQPAQPRADPQAGRQPAAARRADQRPRRRDAASLESALLEFPGCAVVVSHDRWFLDRVATHILAYEGDSKWFWFEGNFAGLREEQGRAARAGGGPPAPRHLPQAHPRARRRGMTRFTARVAMRWSDMDAYGHVNNVQFLTYVEEARVEMFQAVPPLSGAEHRVDQVSAGILVKSSDITYLRPLFHRPAPVPIDVWVTKVGAAHFCLAYEVHDDDGTIYAQGVVGDGAVRLRCRAPAAADPARAGVAHRVPRAGRHVTTLDLADAHETAGLVAYLGPVGGPGRPRRGPAAELRAGRRRVGRSADGRADAAAGRPRVRAGGAAGRSPSRCAGCSTGSTGRSWTAARSSCRRRSPARHGRGCCRRGGLAGAGHRPGRRGRRRGARRRRRVPPPRRGAARRRPAQPAAAGGHRATALVAAGASPGSRCAPLTPPSIIGLLSREGEVRALESGPWQRLACPGGSVVLRRDGAGTGLGLDLGVWSLLAQPGSA